MAVLRCNIDGKPRHELLQCHANRRGRTVLFIGSNPDNNTGAQRLILPTRQGIEKEHVLIVETKNMPVFVLLNRSSGLTYVKGIRVTQLKVLRHQDRITLGRKDQKEKINLIFDELQIERLKKPFKCKICGKNRAIVFHCPVCPDRQYCRECVLTQGLTCGGCGYNFKEAVKRSIQSENIRGFFKGVENEHLKIETVGPESSLLEHYCSIPESADTPHNLRKFHQNDIVTYCPICNFPYHMNCWLSRASCVNPRCGTRIKPFLETVFKPTEERL